MRRRLATLAAGLVLAGALAGCADDEPRQAAGEPTSEPTSEPTEPSSTAESVAPTDDETDLVGGPAEEPAPVEPTTDLLEWTRVPGPSTTTVTRSGAWTLTVDEGGGRATLRGPGGTEIFVADSRQQISDALIDGDWAVVVFQDELETAPASAEVVALNGAGGTFTVDDSSDVPTTTGGTWALGDGTLVHPTIGPGGSYCLATVDLDERSSERTWCAEKRHGFNAARITPE
ncbi:MAG TPA: hypothetical protein VFY58_04145, partial [Nocardioides sp.]|nr:hypothetical protein [Nocardioides sp.]